ncbi:MAG: hypothetical protein ACE5F6_01915 [Anaerolineae bacterium]
MSGCWLCVARGQQVRISFKASNNSQSTNWFDLDDVTLETCSGPCTLAADVDGDADVDLTDLQLVAAAWRSTPPDLRYDVDQDGDVDVVDVMRVTAAQGNKCQWVH